MLCCAVLTASWAAAPAPAADFAQPPSESDALTQTYAAIERGNAMKALAQLEGFKSADSPLRGSSGISAYLRAVYSWVGLYREALAEADSRSDPERGEATGQLATLQQRSALEVIKSQARDARLVMLNEAHHVPQHRAFAIEVLIALRELGFTHFAAETLNEADAALSTRGFPTVATGFYSAEPVYGDLIRTALRLGYRVVPYEGIVGEGEEAREAGQARNIVERVFNADPSARLFMFAGYGHIREGGPGRIETVAQRLRTQTRINPLTIDQSRMSESSTPRFELPLYREATRIGEFTEPVAFVDSSGGPWSDKPDWYDIVVFSPRSVYEHGRPHWLAMNGKRGAAKLKRKICGDAPRCLVSARYAAESAEAIPVDQIVVDATRPERPFLMLPKGEFTITVTDAKSEALREFKLLRR
jgi:hypothetical protein